MCLFYATHQKSFFSEEPIVKVDCVSSQSGGSSILSSDVASCSLSIPSLAVRTSSKASSAMSPWEKLPRGVKHHPISKYSSYERLDPDKEWVLEALELPGDANEDEVFKRMYEFQRMGKLTLAGKLLEFWRAFAKMDGQWLFSS